MDKHPIGYKMGKKYVGSSQLSSWTRSPRKTPSTKA